MTDQASFLRCGLQPVQGKRTYQYLPRPDQTCFLSYLATNTPTYAAEFIDRFNMPGSANPLLG